MTSAFRTSTGWGERWEAWPGAVYMYISVWDDVDPRTVQWRRTNGSIEVYV